MVKVGLNVKNGSKIFKPTAGDVVIYDGKDWYVTTKDDLFREYQAKVNAVLLETTEKLDKIEAFKQEISSQMLEMSEIIKKFVVLQGEK